MLWTVFMGVGFVGYAQAVSAAGRPLLQASNLPQLLGAPVVYAVGLASLLLSAIPFELNKHARKLAVQGRCGVCSYDLAQVPPAPDTCRLCPECGAAWRPRLP